MGTLDTRPFHFKQFSLYHHRSTMKVGTDAVLLALWTPLDKVVHVLDVGTGSGVIALLLAARSAQIQVDAVDIDADSAAEAHQNFVQSPFAKRLKAVHSGINGFVASREKKKYDLVISNPPFFINDRKPGYGKRKLARHTDTLSYHQLIAAAIRILKPAGFLSVVLPYREGKIFLQLAEESGLFLHRKLLIFPKPCYEPNRVNLLLAAFPAVHAAEKLVIRNEDGSFTSQYLDMVKNYYLSP